MTVERFVPALRRMVSAAKGMCSIILSYIAKKKERKRKTVKAANKELQQCWIVPKADQTQVKSLEKKIQWKIIVERAPWRVHFRQDNSAERLQS